MSVQVNNLTLDVQEFATRVVAIVQFGPAGFATDGMKPGEFYQVTIDPRKISPSGQFIRFGDSPGDEIVGWQRCKALTVLEVLGEWPFDQDERPTLEYGKSGHIEFLIPLKQEAT